MLRKLLLSAACITACISGASSAHAAQRLLFSPASQAAGLSSDRSYRALADNPAAVAVETVRADAALIDVGNKSLRFAMNGRTVTAHQRSAHTNSDGTLVWYGHIDRDFSVFDTLQRVASGESGEIADDPNNSVMIVRNGDKLTGTLRIGGEFYALRPLHNGDHAIAKIDEMRMPSDHPAAYAQLPHIAMPQTKTGVGDISAQAISTIRVMVVATQSAANASGDIVGLVNLAVAESNQGYVNSGVEINLELAGRYTTSYVESSSFSTDLSRFRGTTDGYMDSYHSTRNTVAADVMMLLINNSSSCGLASGIGSTASTAFAVAHYGCATGYYSFAHEIGHLQSARHDPATDSTNTPYAYGHGYRSPTNAWRTIMAYNCSPSCPRINYWSNPAKTYGGQAMGTTASSHNQRVLNNTKATIAAFR